MTLGSSRGIFFNLWYITQSKCQALQWFSYCKNLPIKMFCVRGSSLLFYSTFASLLKLESTQYLTFESFLFVFHMLDYQKELSCYCRHLLSFWCACTLTCGACPYAQIGLEKSES